MAYVITFGELIGGALPDRRLPHAARRRRASFIEMILAIAAREDRHRPDRSKAARGPSSTSTLLAAMAAVASFGPGSLSVDRNVGIEGRLT